MEIVVNKGFGAIGIGFGFGSYFRFKRPVAVIWPDWRGSIGEYLAVMPVSPNERLEIQERINSSLFEDYKGREDALYKILEPLFQLFENGTYRLNFTDGTEERFGTSYSGGNFSEYYELGWYVAYAKIADRHSAKAEVHRYKKYINNSKTGQWRGNILEFSTSGLYEWREDIYVATRPEAELNPERISWFEEKIKEGDRPFALVMSAERFGEDAYSAHFVLDGHHKMAAYKKLDIRPPIAFITRVLSNTEPAVFDIEALAGVMYPWQIKHIVKNSGKNGLVGSLMENPKSNLYRAMHARYDYEYMPKSRLFKAMLWFLLLLVLVVVVIIILSDN